MRDEFLITRSGKQYVLFAGLLDEAHERGLRGIDTELVQVPSDENGNVAVVKATVEMEGPEGTRTFGGIGDASPENVGRNIVPHLIRMAETRAKARALRDAVNVGATALEELSDGDDAPPASSGYSSSGRGGGRSSGPRPVQDGSGAQTANGGETRGRNQRSSDSGKGSSQSAGQKSGAQSGPRPVEAEPEEEPSGSKDSGGKSGGSGAGANAKGSGKARKSQVDLLKTLAVELRGEGGVERLETRIGKSLTDLTRTEADEWIDRLTPKEDQE